MDYTESQKIAADPTRDAIVTAGAGTGKTTVLSLRTLRYLEDFDPSQISDAVKKIVAITFTNKAANEMRERIFEQVFARFREATTGREAQKWFKIYRDIENAQISTIHSLCRTLLTRFPLEAEVMPNFSVDNAAIDPAEYIEEFLDKMATEKSELMRKVRDYADRWEIRNILTAIYEGRQYLSESLYQLRGESPDKLAKKYADFIENYGGNVTDTNADSFMDSLLQVADITIKIAQLYTEFEKFIRSGYRAVSTLDFNQLVIGGLKLVKQFSEEQMKYIAPEQLMVDEFQDTSPIQWELIEHLAGYSGRVMFVGDEKQSIYRFRGADVTVVRSGEEFIGRRAQKTIVSMDKNFRTHPRLLSVINRIFKGIFPEISQNDYEARYQELIPGEEKKWENPQKAGFYIVLPDSFESQEEAVSGIIKQILAEKDEWDEEDLGKFMVLADSNRMVSKVVNHLRREGIPALALTPHGFWASEEISFFVHLLNFLHEPRNTKDLFYLLTSPIFGVDSETIRRLPSSTPEDFLWNRIEKNYQDGTIENEALKKGYEKLKQVLEEAKDRPVWRIISDFLDDERIFSILTGSAPEVKIPNLLKLMDIITSYEWAGMNLEQIVEQVNAAEEENETPLAGPINTKNFVQVSTIHSAKGLEAQIVIVLDKYSLKSDNDAFYFEKEIPGKFIPKIKQLQELTPVLCGGRNTGSVSYELSKNKREAEDKRLLYVALTRAQEKVYLVPHKNKRNQSWWLGKIKEALGIKKNEDLKNPSALPEGVQVIALDHILQKETLFDRKPQGSVAEFLESIPPDRAEISATVLAEFLLCPQFFAFNTNPPEDAGRFGFSLKKSDAAERGKKIHQLASLVAVYPPEEIFTYAESIIGDPQKAEKIASLLEKFYHDEISKCPQTPQTEVPLVFSHGGITISGQADLICGNTIYDFKTGRKDDFARALYSIQLDLYRLACAAAREISPGEIETKIVWLSEDDFEIQTTPHDPEILRKIEDFKKFIQSGEMPAAKPQPFCRDCTYKNNCNFPNSC